MPVISGVTINNGVNYYTTDSYSEKECFNNSLTISTRGEYSGTVTYHEGNFLLANNILVLTMDGLTKNSKLFIGSLINQLSYGGYFGYPRKETLKDDVIKLPTINGKIDFDFMDSFIAKLEEERVVALSTYLKRSGLDNYELSVEELDALGDYDSAEWREYRLGDIFEVKTSKKRFDANKVNLVENGGYPYIVRKGSDNGMKGRIDEETKFLNSGNTISFGQDTATAFYQDKPYFTGDKIKILYPKFEKFNKNNALFFVAAIARSFSKFSWGGSSYRVNVIRNQKLILPVKNDIIDLNFMENFTRAIAKKCIKDVIQCTVKRIESTKKI